MHAGGTGCCGSEEQGGSGEQRDRRHHRFPRDEVAPCARWSTRASSDLDAAGTEQRIPLLEQSDDDDDTAKAMVRPFRLRAANRPSGDRIACARTDGTAAVCVGVRASLRTPLRARREPGPAAAAAPSERVFFRVRMTVHAGSAPAVVGGCRRSRSASYVLYLYEAFALCTELVFCAPPLAAIRPCSRFD